MINDVHTANGKSISDVLHDFKNEFSIFVATRLQLLQEEMSQKATAIKAALPMMIVGLVFLLTTLFLFTGALVALIAVLLAGNRWAYVISFAAVGVVYGILGAILAMIGKSALAKQGVKPEKTIRVLQDDKVWLKTETTRLQA